MNKAAELKLHIDIFPFVNISLYLNSIPFIQSSLLENAGETDYYRSNDNVEKRDMQAIAPEKMALACYGSRVPQPSIEEEESLRYVARVFGFAKVG